MEVPPGQHTIMAVVATFRAIVVAAHAVQPAAMGVGNGGVYDQRKQDGCDVKHEDDCRCETGQKQGTGLAVAVDAASRRVSDTRMKRTLATAFLCPAAGNTGMGGL